MANGKTWFHVAARGATRGRVQILNAIGDYGVTAQDFSNALDELGDVEVLDIVISSDGGDVAQGTAIFNLLRDHGAHKVVTIQGLAASMASVIAMAGDEINMPKNSMLMIHNPWGGVVGDSEQVKSFGEALEMMQDNIASAYVDRTGIGKPKVLDMMARETWLTAQKAKDLGFCDNVVETVAVSARFDTSKFNKVPASFGRILEGAKTMSKTKTNAAKNDDSDSESEDGKASVKSQAELRSEINAQNKEVRSMCAMAGKAELADGFIDEGKSLSEVVAALDEAKKKDKPKANDVNARKAGGGQGGDDGKPKAVIDPKAIYKNWNGKK